MDERTDWVRAHQARESPPRFEGWRDDGEHTRAKAGAPGGRGIPDLSALVAIVEALRRAVPHELQEQFTARLYGQSLPTSLIMDEGVAQVALKRLARQVERAPRDATVALVGAQVLSEPASMGRALDVNETIARLKQSIGQGSADGLEIALAVNEEQPVVRDAGDGVNQMRAMLSGPEVASAVARARATKATIG